MKFYTLFLHLMAASLMSQAADVLAAETMLKACKSEIGKYSCDALSESYAYDCLHKHREARVKNKGFTRRCFKAYAAYEKASGKGDKIESHEAENPEHSN